eukprot:353387-Pelagomonas_calceolata.AAC.1
MRIRKDIGSIPCLILVKISQRRKVKKLSRQGKLSLLTVVQEKEAHWLKSAVGHNSQPRDATPPTECKPAACALD